MRYSLQVTADGVPAPRFELTSAPAGMSIGTASGLIEWAPGGEAAGTHVDGRQELSDAVFVFNFLFAGGLAPSCDSAADVNRDFRIDLSDGVSLLNFLFLGGSTPSDPFTSCGTATDPGELACLAYDRCG